MRTLALLLAVSAFAALAWMRGEGGGERAAAPAPPRESCAGCHTERQPGLMAQWEEGAHARHGVACEECHGDDHDAIFNVKGHVPVSTCGRCHPRATSEFLGSAHDRSASDASKNARLLAQIPAMQRRGCMTCHDIGTGKEGRCNSCHGAHRFSAADARRPESCGQCHMGPDHPQIEAYDSSRHGVVYRATGDERQAPTCATCHMPDGTHDVSGGVTIGRAGSGAVFAGETPPIPMKTITPEAFAERREAMLQVCARCHSPRFARSALEDADAIKRDADRILREAARIVQGLYDDGLLDPMPEERPAHPTAGHALVLGGPALYEGHSEPERIFFDIAKFAHAITYKGAYHQSADYTHWLGNARLKEGLEALRAEERRLR